METAQIYAKLTQILQDVLGDDLIALAPTTVASDIDGWDSFNHLNIIVAVETSFGIRFGTRDIDSLHTIGDLVRAISDRIAG